jgi:uncharacterized OsmC-like protein
MYRVTLDDSNQIHVSYKNHTISYGQDGSLPNPLEAAYAALAGCAGVYARKACKAHGLNAEGIEIHSKPVVRGGGSLLVPSRFVTEVRFPVHFSTLQRHAVLDEINRCAVKQLIHDGANIEFSTIEAFSAE